MSQNTAEGDAQEATTRLPPVGGRPVENDTENRRPSLTPTEILILDLLASGPLDRDTLFARAEPSIWGHHVTVAAVEAGHRADNEYQLMVLGKEPAFERALDSLRRQRFVRRERGGLLTVKGARRGAVVDADGELVPYEPGTQARETTRWQIENTARDMERARPEIVEQLSPPMSDADFTLLVESMRIEGFDPLLPITIDRQTGKVVDGHQRLRAAGAAGVKPRFRRVGFKSDAERLRFIARSNLHRRNISPGQRTRFEKALSQLGVSMRDVTGIIGRLAATGRGSNVLHGNPIQHGALGKVDDGGDGASITSRPHGMSRQTRQQVVELLQGIREQSPGSMREMRKTRQMVVRTVANRFGKAEGTILNPVVRNAGHSSAVGFDRLALDWLEGDGSALLESILGSDRAKWDQEDADALRELVSESQPEHSAS